MIAVNTPQGGHVRLILFVCQRTDMALGSLHGSFARPLLCRGFCGRAAVQSGAQRFALIAFQLLTLPLEFTLKAL